MCGLYPERFLFQKPWKHCCKEFRRVRGVHSIGAHHRRPAKGKVSGCEERVFNANRHNKQDFQYRWVRRFERRHSRYIPGVYCL